MGENKLFQTIDLCRFCTREFPECGAQPVYSKVIDLKQGHLDSEASVIACDRYESPVDVLKKKFHG